ncbi:autotransporter domain-containing protein [Rhizobium sp. BK251]|uniref:autotransporter family protein n=1 Tax=Rhizobium sp. BK251 TaxID=2512125 RepID=UPI00104CAF7A|nr:autotransporter domain-containing protein [Rhizobium sp. BK251]
MTVNVLPGANVYAPIDITGPGSSAVNNSGAINSNVVGTANGSFGVVNDSVITSNVRAVDNGTFNLTNNGTISGSIFLDGGGVNTIVNNSGANIQNGVVASRSSTDFLTNFGLIAVSVSLGAGDDRFDLLGGIVSTGVDLGPGNDTFNWTAGNVTPSITLGAGNDRALLKNLTSTNLTQGLPVDGGLGSDELVWDNTSNVDASALGDDVSRFTNWEAISLTNGSQLTFTFVNNTLRLGDSGTGSGTLSVDATSTVFAGNRDYAIAPFTAGQLVTVSNAGLIDLTNSMVTTNDRFVVNGNYIGLGGRLNLQTVLASDGAPSDQLVISGAGASGSGTTSIFVDNINGPGDLTAADGIMVIDAANGATTSANAFTLGRPVGAGVFEYSLYQGGVSSGSENDWFLRSNAPPTEPPPTETPPTEPPITEPPPSPTSPSSPPPAGPASIRPEIPAYTIAPAVARQMGLATLGTFHERQGDQFLLTNKGEFSAAWGRVFGKSYDEHWNATVSGLSNELDPQFDGSIWGLQLGLDVLGTEHDDGSQDRAGLFYAHTEASGDVIGNTLGRLDQNSGNLDLSGDSIGGYWTHTGAQGWYIDAVAMYTWLGGDAISDRGIGADMDGSAALASLEGGYPIVLSDNWTLEPQIQGVWQRVDLDDTNDPFTSIDYDGENAFAGRIGARLEGKWKAGTAVLQPFVDANLWQLSSATDTTTFNLRSVSVSGGSTVLAFGAGLSAQLSTNVSLYGAAIFSTNVGDEKAQTFGGNIGLRVQW